MLGNRWGYLSQPYVRQVPLPLRQENLVSVKDLSLSQPSTVGSRIVVNPFTLGTRTSPQSHDVPQIYRGVSQGMSFVDYR